MSAAARDPVIAIRDLQPIEALEVLAQLVVSNPGGVTWRREMATAMRLVARRLAK